ncbi:acyl-CoA dehydrogenase family protein [Mycobacterium sp. BMJ-28]
MQDDRPADLETRVQTLLERHPPSACGAHDFLGARFDAGLAWVGARPEDGGCSADPALQSWVESRLAAAGAPEPFALNPIGLGMIAPTLLAHGSPAIRGRYLRPLFTAQEIWCQLFSEPSAGSDIAGLATRARRDGADWLVEGQKLWTSYAQQARRGLLMARTDPDQPKHAGLTAFVVDMHAPGVDVVPLRQITGDAEFNEVYFTDVAVPDGDRIGDVGHGWQVVTTTLMNERTALGGAMSNRVGAPGDRIIDGYRAAAAHELGDPVRRDRCIQLWTEANVVALTVARASQAVATGAEGPHGSILKLAGAEHNQRASEFILDIGGLTGVGADTGNTMTAAARGYLRARANTIEGGTSEIMRNILGERVLGLPADARVDKNIPWRDVPR